MIRVFFWIVLLLLTQFTTAQELRIDGLGGQIYKHSKQLLFEPPSFSSGVEATYYIDHFNEKEWVTYWGDPRPLLAAHVVNFGNRDVLGTAIGFTPGIHFNLFKRGHFQVLLGLTSGISYVTRTYDFNDNPSNNAIGSHWNNATIFKLSINYKRFWLGGGLYHHSNGASSSPNRGINTFMLTLGYSILDHQHSKSLIEYQRKRFASEPYKKWGVDVLYIHGFNQYIVPGGPSYNFISGSGSLYKSIGKYMRLHMGFTYEFNETRYYFLLNDFNRAEDARISATNRGIFTAIELFFGNVSIRPKVGFYLPKPNGERDNDYRYIKLESNYYPFGRNRRVSPYIGAVIKSHNLNAQYVGFQVGINL